MRLAVLLCGVVAGVVGLGFGWWGNPSALVDIYGLSMPLFIAAVLVIHIVSVVSIAGGLLVLASPRVGGMMMLGSATAWLLVVALIGGGLGVSIGALIAVAAGGGLLAFLPSLKGPAFLIERADEDEEQAPRQLAEPRQQAEDYANPYGWSSPVLDAYEDHSQPFRVDDLELSAEDRPERLNRAFEVRGMEVRPLPYKTRRRKGARARAIGGLVALAVVLIGVPTLLVLDYQMHVEPAAPVVAAAAVPAETVVAPKAAPVAEPSLPAPVPDRLEATGPLPDPTFEASATPSIAALPMPPQSAAFASPFEYCADIPNKDEPDLRLIGEGLPPELIDGVRQVTNMPDGEVRWRCMNAAVWICAQPVGGAACGKVPTAAERQAYCDANPGAQAIAAAAGSWSCSGTTPMVPEAAGRTIDPRGFDRLAWLALSKAPNEAG